MLASGVGVHRVLITGLRRLLLLARQPRHDASTKAKIARTQADMWQELLTAPISDSIINPR